MASAALAGLLVFAAVIISLRIVEWGYHKWRHTSDWSPHWGSWAFAALAGLWTLLTNLGR
jgi:hypothetical protein